MPEAPDTIWELLKPTMRIGKGQFIAVLLLLSLLLPGCGRQATVPPAFEKSGDRGPAAWRVAASRTSLSTAEELVLQESITTPDAATVTWPDLPAALAEHFTVVEAKPLSRPATKGRIYRERSLRLYPKHPGTIEIPARQIKVSNGGNTESPLELPAFSVTVASVVKGATPLPEPLTMRLAKQIPWKWLGLAVGLLLLAAVAVWYWRRPGPAAASAPAIPLVPPAEEALLALARLEASGLIAAGRFKEFYLDLTTLLRRYLERRFGVAALERTTDEFLAETRGDPRFAGSEFQILPSLLGEADLVKFAEVQPGPGAAGAALAACRRFVEVTRPVPNPVPSSSPDTPAGGAA